MIKFKAKVENIKQLDIALSYDCVSEIVLARDSFNEKDLPRLVSKIKANNKNAWIMLERISRYEEKMETFSKNKNPGSKQSLRLSSDEIYKIENLDGIIIQNIDSFAYMLRKINTAKNSNLLVELNYTMNCYNNETKKIYEILYSSKRLNHIETPLFYVAPLELNVYELNSVSYEEFIVYSYIDTMVSANCLRKNTESPIKIKKNNLCSSKFDFNNVKDFHSYIVDRKNKKLHYKTYCKYCYNKIFNTEPLYLIDKIDEIMMVDWTHINNLYKNLKLENRVLENITPYRIDFSFENEKEMIDILDKKCPESFTRGHIKSGIK